MADAYLTALHVSRGACSILLGQKNIYLPPHGRYQYASIARNAVQFVVPGGRVQPGERHAAAAVREFYEDTGVEVPIDEIQPLIAEGAESDAESYTFFKVINPADIDLDAINAALAEGRASSQKLNSVQWVPLEQALSKLGNKEAYQALPWVTNQVVRALNAGFSREVIGMRANDPYLRFTRACAQAVLDFYGAPVSSPSGATAVPAGRLSPPSGGPAVAGVVDPPAPTAGAL